MVFRRGRFKLNYEKERSRLSITGTRSRRLSRSVGRVCDERRLFEVRCMVTDIGALHELRREMKNLSMETNWSTCFVYLLYAMWGGQKKNEARGRKCSFVC